MHSVAYRDQKPGAGVQLHVTVWLRYSYLWFPQFSLLTELWTETLAEAGLKGVREGGGPDFYTVKVKRKDKGSSHVTRRIGAYGGNCLKLIIRALEGRGDRGLLEFTSLSCFPSEGQQVNRPSHLHTIMLKFPNEMLAVQQVQIFSMFKFG